MVNRDACEFQILHRDFVVICASVDDARQARVDKHFCAGVARLMRRVNRAAFDRDAVERGLMIAFCSACKVRTQCPSTISHPASKQCGKPRGAPLYPVVKMRLSLTMIAPTCTMARRTFCNGVRDFDEIFVPTGSGHSVTLEVGRWKLEVGNCDPDAPTSNFQHPIPIIQCQTADLPRPPSRARCTRARSGDRPRRRGKSPRRDAHPAIA